MAFANPDSHSAFAVVAAATIQSTGAAGPVSAEANVDVPLLENPCGKEVEGQGRLGFTKLKYCSRAAAAVGMLH